MAKATKQEVLTAMLETHDFSRVRFTLSNNSVIINERGTSIMYAIYTDDPVWRVSKITEWHEHLYHEMQEYNDVTAVEAKENGLTYAHLYEYDQEKACYEYVTSIIL